MPHHTIPIYYVRSSSHLTTGVCTPEMAVTAVTALSASPPTSQVEEEQEESDNDIDLFSDNFDPAAEEFQRTLHQRAELARRDKLALLPPPLQRTCADSRTAYVLSGQRLAPTVTPQVLNTQECERIIDAVVAYVHTQGGLHTQRHEAFATTDVPVSSLTLPWPPPWCSQRTHSPALTMTTGDAVRQCVMERVLGPLARATGFAPHHLGLKDLFVVCYSAGHATPDEKAMQHAIPSKQASLAMHSDGCLLSFSLLLNHHDAFQGGGTFFKTTGHTFHLQQGGLLVHDAGLERE